jgi:hypothetical protein
MADNIEEVFDGDLEIHPPLLGDRPADPASQAVQDVVLFSH